MEWVRRDRGEATCCLPTGHYGPWRSYLLIIITWLVVTSFSGKGAGGMLTSSTLASCQLVQWLIITWVVVTSFSGVLVGCWWDAYLVHGQDIYGHGLGVGGGSWRQPLDLFVEHNGPHLLM